MWNDHEVVYIQFVQVCLTWQSWLWLLLFRWLMSPIDLLFYFIVTTHFNFFFIVIDIRKIKVRGKMPTSSIWANESYTGIVLIREWCTLLKTNGKYFISDMYTFSFFFRKRLFARNRIQSVEWNFVYIVTYTCIDITEHIMHLMLIKKFKLRLKACINNTISIPVKK